MKRQLFNLKWRLYHPRAHGRFKRLLESQYWSSDQMQARSEEARKRIVTVAMTMTAFYPKFYGDVGFELGDMAQDGWFERLPVLTKRHLREHFEDMTNASLRRFRATSTTGGSTGEPTRTGYDRRFPEEVYGWRLQSWFGIHPGDDRANVWRATHMTAKARFLNALFWWPTRHLKLDATFISEGSLVDFINRYNVLRPGSLEGYVGGIMQLAEYAQQNRITLWAPKLVQVTSSPLSAVQKNLLRQVFRAPICDQYGSCEIRWLAQSCPQDCGLHVNTEHVHLEFVDETNKPRESGLYGRALLTNLEDEVFPMIRYENGDRGRYLPNHCQCGRSLPLIDSVKGRESESFVLPSGKTINGEFLTTLFDDTPELVRSFRLIQHKSLSITVIVVPASFDAKKEIVKVISTFAQKIGNEVSVDYQFVDTITADKGKLRFVVREV